jgi:class 3 adenylate cyclase
VTDARDAELSKLRKDLRVIARRLEQCQRNRKELGYLKDKLDHVLVREEEARIEIERKSTELADLNARLEAERRRSDDLLQNLLPSPTVRELREHGRVEARIAESATVLFADFVHFTDMAKRMAPADIVAALDHMFSLFDPIATGHDLEPLKTMGDAYRCVGSLFSLSSDGRGGPVATVRAALEMIAATRRNERHLAPAGTRWQLRVGIHTGPLVSGLVGHSKLTFDVWGETVNLASRFKEASEAGRVNVSRTTANACGGAFRFASRGLVEVKSRGRVEMLFVEG